MRGYTALRRRLSSIANKGFNPTLPCDFPVKGFKHSFSSFEKLDLSIVSGTELIDEFVRVQLTKALPDT
ncbi:hypothetical protein C495_01090 [Natronorubrum sulfidifaciens JCM 14089]|uniref:Uncharacterized protein n=1 Tax=Natronorubrum sulfidifaciens JCM 14089 TaxID=1230460 RepID=L9WK84_9EURY|nr:hypothetical protein C495_01090 [Natronorubrum sulfidifaciens JCM 14089]